MQQSYIETLISVSVLSMSNIFLHHNVIIAIAFVHNRFTNSSQMHTPRLLTTYSLEHDDLISL